MVKVSGTVDANRTIHVTDITPAGGGVLKIDNGAALTLENGSYPTLGTVTLNSVGSVTDLVIGGANVTLSGGTLTMSNNAENFIFGATGADTLTNKETRSEEHTTELQSHLNLVSRLLLEKQN